MIQRIDHARLRRSGCWARRAVLTLSVALASCSSVSDQHIGTVLPEKPELGDFDAGNTAPVDARASDGSASDARTSEASSCGQPQKVNGEEPTLALYILLDRSSAMRDPMPEFDSDKWNRVRAGLEGYLGTASPDLYAGLAYFPVEDRTPCPCNGQPNCNNCWERPPVCTPAAYEPAVKVGRLGDQYTSLTGTLDSTEPNRSFGGLAPAVQESESQLQSWQKAASRSKAVRVIITASPPPFDYYSCGEGVTLHVSDRVESSEFRTYVVAVGSDRGDVRRQGYDQLADEGSARKEAFFFDTQNPKPVDAMVDILRQIVEGEKGCDYLVPAGIDTATIRLDLVRPGADSSAPSTLTQLPNRQSCGYGGGWYAKPDRISLCDSTCVQLNKDRLTASLVSRCADSITH